MRRSTLRWFGVFVVAAIAVLAGGVGLAYATIPGNGEISLAATLGGSTVHTFSDLAKRLNADDGIADIIEMLGQRNEILEDMMWKEGNLLTGERTTVRTGLPTVAWRLLNQGVQPSKSTTAQIDEACGKLEAWCEIDEELIRLNGNDAEYRLSEASSFVEAMNQEFAQTLIYGNAGISPEEFTGLAVRYSSRSAAVANSQNIVHAGGAGADNTSIWLICWGQTTVHGVYPKGSKGGLEHNDLGIETVETTNGIGGSRMRAYRDQWKWDVGIALRDWRYAVRIANIDVSDLIADTAGATVKLIEYLTRALNRLPNRGVGKCAFYANRTVQSMLMLQALNKSTNALSVQEAVSQFGNGISELRFLGVPIRTVDQILETEATVT
jgi:hypothetical protein